MGIHDRDWIRPESPGGRLRRRWATLDEDRKAWIKAGAVVLLLVAIIGGVRLWGRRSGAERLRELDELMGPQVAFQMALVQGDAMRLREMLASDAELARAPLGDGPGGPLHLVATVGSFMARSREASPADVTRLLIDHGADPDAPGDGGSTPLHLAASAGNASVATALIEKGADVSARDMVGFTPLICAARESNAGCLDIAKQLLDAGADVNARSPDGQTALGVAEKAGKDRMVALLRQNGATGGD